MLEEQSGSESQEKIEQDVQTESQDSGQNTNDTLNQEKAYSQKQRQRAQKAEAELEKMNARNKKIEEDSMVEQNKFRELWEKDKVDAEWARGYRQDRRASLLKEIPEAKREKFEKMNLGLEALEAIVEEISTTPKETMKAVPGQVAVPSLNKPYQDMTTQERKDYHTQVLNSRK